MFVICGGAYQREPTRTLAAEAAPSAVHGAMRRWPWLASPRTRTRPCGFSRQGRGKRVREKSEREASSRPPRSPKETHSSRRQAHRGCGQQQQQQQPTKQTYPVAAGKPARGTPKAEDLWDFWGEEVCLRVVPTVGIAVGTPVGIFLGGVGIPVGTQVGTPVGTRRRGIHAARNRLTRSSTSDCDRPKRLRLISISRRASCRRARGAS